MLVGQQLGPFAIDKEIGSGAMGAVYRARYVKTGQVVAVKVMAPGIGTTNPHAADRFEREASILKQLNHPNIVRLFGAGKSHGTRYYAMEYIQGESLDRVMSRRDRMSWEEVVSFGQQLCAALQHAHEQGVVHRDLKPSNLMILRDGTLKLTDFGIAKDLDRTQLTSANCTVGTAAYMSPEQCRGDRDLTHKSDLYSLGVVFYELLTGRKPFEAENAMDMFMQHVQGEFVRPSKLVDMPVWLDTLVCQLLEKKPEHRPLDAGTVYATLGSIQEKVEAKRSAGVEAAKERVIDRPRGAPRPDETDREMARTLLTGKGRKKRRKRERFYEKGWFVTAAALALLGALAFALYLVLSPPAPGKLYARAKTLMESSDHEEHTKALDGPITQYLTHYNKVAGEQTEQVRRWADDVRVEQKEDLISHYLAKKGKHMDVNDEWEAAAFKAADAEMDGNLSSARRQWEDIREKQGQAPWGLTAGRHVQAIEAVDRQDDRWRQMLDALRTNGREPKLPALEQDAFRAFRAEHLGEPYAAKEKKPDADLPLARQIYDDVRERAEKQPDQRLWFLLAARKARDLKEDKKPDSDTVREDRKAMLQRALAFAEANTNTGALLGARAVAMDVAFLYGDDPELAPLVARAKEVVQKVNHTQGVFEDRQAAR